MAGGRPPFYTSATKMQEAIDAYFVSCKGEPFLDDNGEAVIDKYGKHVIVGAKPPTVTGLALALGFTSRLALLNYQGRSEFVNTVTRAKAVIEAYAEARLFDRDGVQGAKFSLSNNFSGWAEKSDINMNLSQEEASAKVKAMVERARSERDTGDI
jgi:hypothetical protein